MVITSRVGGILLITVVGSNVSQDWLSAVMKNGTSSSHRKSSFSSRLHVFSWLSCRYPVLETLIMSRERSVWYACKGWSHYEVHERETIRRDCSLHFLLRVRWWLGLMFPLHRGHLVFEISKYLNISNIFSVGFFLSFLPVSLSNSFVSYFI